ncbi:MAG: hypothetical protein RID07_18390 [Lacipirellulaceae bacterium]
MLWVFWPIVAAVIVDFWYFEGFELFGSGTKYFILYVLAATILSEVLFNSKLHLPRATIAPSERSYLRIVAALIGVIVMVISVANF